MSKIIILGAGGMLGHKLCQQLSAQGREIVATLRSGAGLVDRYPDVFGHTRIITGVDVLEWEALRRLLERERPAAVINCIGLVKQLETANNLRLAVGLNSYLPQLLEQICGSIGARMVHFSTDCVFSGERGRYTETDPSDAKDIYGKSKFLGETAGAEGDAVTIRSSIIGRELTLPTHGLVEWFLAQHGKTVSGYAGALYTGFSTLEMARVVALLLDRAQPLRGTYSVASAPISKFDLLRIIRDAYGMDTVVTRDDRFVCDRSLVMNRFTDETGYVAPSWPDMIRAMAADPTQYDNREERIHA